MQLATLEGRILGCGRTDGRQVATFLEGQEEGQVTPGEARSQAAEARGTQSQRGSPQPSRRDLASLSAACRPSGRARPCLVPNGERRAPSGCCSGRFVPPTWTPSLATQPTRSTCAS